MFGHQGAGEHFGGMGFGVHLGRGHWRRVLHSERRCVGNDVLFITIGAIMYTLTALC